jgi:hypothetical protein
MHPDRVATLPDHPTRFLISLCMQLIDAPSDQIRAKVSRITVPETLTPSHLQLIAWRRSLIMPASHLITPERCLITRLRRLIRRESHLIGRSALARCMPPVPEAVWQA